MKRIALGIEYDGQRYHGWQRQPHAPSVQESLERALSRVADHPVTAVCAGRTDTGVHATGQVVHFDTGAARPERAWIHGVNANLPEDIGVFWAREVAEDFHARFSATARAYRYVILSQSVRPVLDRHRVAWTWKPLDADLMGDAARHLLGQHDFSSFRAAACQAKHPVRTVRRLDVRRVGARIVFEIEADGFLHHMVRNIAGVLMAIGAKEHPPAWARAVLAARDRTVSGVTAPAAGLYMVAARYPERFGVPASRIAAHCILGGDPGESG